MIGERSVQGQRRGFSDNVLLSVTDASNLEDTHVTLDILFTPYPCEAFPFTRVLVLTGD